MKPITREQLLLELEDLQAQLDETQETLRAFRSGEVDGLIVPGLGGDQLFTLKGADYSYRILIEEMSEGALTLTAEGMILYANRCFAEMLKTPLEKVIGSMIHTWIAPDGQRILQTLLRKGVAERRRDQLGLIAADGTPVSIHLSVSNLLIKDIPNFFCLVATDLTEQKRSDAIAASEKLAQELLAASNQSRLALLGEIDVRKQMEVELREEKILTEAVVENVPLMIFLKESTDLRFVIFNRAGEELLGYDRKSLLGKNNLDLFPPEQAAHFMVKDREVLDGEIGLLDIPEEAILTAKKGTRILHTRKVCIRGSDGATKFLLGISEDITERKQAEKDLLSSLEKHRKALGGIIRAIALTVEMKDPYTAGHQQRVANLAKVTAQEMGLSVDQGDGLYLAAIIHDLGKIAVPAEILSKPTKLSNIELSLIKVHPQVSYDILKDIDFPWPLAEIVYQHHERMDGSGYPRGLKGDEIIVEARILAVADVVEAIASHRPYRPALGIEVALEEIEKNKGVLYDPVAVEMCLRLFREKGYSLN